jgi:hypothetical protein
MIYNSCNNKDTADHSGLLHMIYDLELPDGRGMIISCRRHGDDSLPTSACEIHRSLERIQFEYHINHK